MPAVAAVFAPRRPGMHYRPHPRRTARLMSLSDTIDVALIGYGFAGRTFHAPLIGGVPGLRLARVVSSDADRVRADLADVQVSRTPDAVWSDPSIGLVVIATPNITHEPLARAALEAGKHVVVDKPFVLDTARARALAELSAARGRLLSVFQNRRWDSDFLAVRAAIESGRLGDVAHFESRIERFRPQVRERWREQAVPGAGLWWDLGPHLVDQALLLFGVPDSVQASFARQRAGASVDDWAHVVLAYARRRVVLHAGMVAAGGMPRFAVHGDRASAVKAKADRQEAQLIAGLRPGQPRWGADDDPLRIHAGEGDEMILPAPDGDQSRYYAAVRDALSGAGPNPVDPPQAIAVMAVLEAAIESARDGRRVEPALDARERAAFDR